MPNKLKELKKELKINEKFLLAKRHPKPNEFSHVKDNIPHKAGYNYMADLLFLPETKEKYKYLLVVTDLASNAFDIELLEDGFADYIEAFENGD